MSAILLYCDRILHKSSPIAAEEITLNIYFGYNSIIFNN
jgi:hypothetical protein